MRPWLRKLIRQLDSELSKVWGSRDLAEFLKDRGETIGIPGSARLGQIIIALQDEGKLRHVELRREGRRSKRGAKSLYGWGEPSAYSLGLSLAGGSYLSHATALFIHGLTDQVPKTIYVNREQTAKPRGPARLSQPAIDRAFGTRGRTSKYVFLSETNRYVILSGKNSGRAGVARMTGPDGESLEVTGLERTLIDIVVRPGYAGGLGKSCLLMSVPERLYRHQGSPSCCRSSTTSTRITRQLDSSCSGRATRKWI